MASIDEMYKRMNENRNIAKEKGNIGENIILAILQDYQQVRPDSFIAHSFRYSLQSDRNNNVYPGNIKKIGGVYQEITRESLEDEIDLVLVTPYRILAIEAKARTGTWSLYDHWTSQNSTPCEKSPITQTEKHARHLYHLLHEVLPDGRPEYIVPITVFVDKAKIVDSRSSLMKSYVKIAVANTLKQLVYNNDVALQYKLNLREIRKVMENNGTANYY